MAVHMGDIVSTHLRDQGVQLRISGQIVAWLEDGPASQTITECKEAGHEYEGHVATLDGDRAVILLESRG